mmetsp:Transcript_104/g.280  ORF Transcript_104/g.280 Transcript_104/m.280 type:complete len:236 (-) Transcript_104:536-1243(-)
MENGTGRSRNTWTRSNSTSTHGSVSATRHAKVGDLSETLAKVRNIRVSKSTWGRDLLHALANFRRAAMAPSEAANASQHDGESRVDDSSAAQAPLTSCSFAPLSTKASALRQRAPRVADGVAFFAAASARFRTDQSGGDRRYDAARTRRPRTSAWHVIRTPSFGKETAMTTVLCWTTAGADTVRDIRSGDSDAPRRTGDLDGLRANIPRNLRWISTAAPSPRKNCQHASWHLQRD